MYWEPIRDATPLIAAQIVFAYAFDLLLSWTRKGRFVLGFGPFPIVYSTNLFLRFRDDWFYLQFAMIAVGFLAKELIQWERDGRRGHVFNPSSFPLALFSLGLIVTGTSAITWAEEIATLLILPPNIYLFIFLVALPGQYLFGVTTMTLPAVLTTYLFSVAYYQATGTYFFFDSNVPIAVFLGMHLLFTDPSTSPRTELGRILFGVCYGLSVVALYYVLDRLGAPTYYDKLLQVPIMNLLVKQFDRAGRAASLAWLNPARLGAGLAPHLRRAAYVSLWIVTFSVMAAAQGLSNDHPGMTVPFWQTACAEGRADACRNLAQMLRRYCRGGSSWSCNELAVLDGTASNRRDPRYQDYLVVLQGGRGPLPDTTPLAVFTRACDQGFIAGCASVGDTYFEGAGGVPKDRQRARILWEDACDRGHPQSCFNLGVMHRFGDGVPADNARAAGFMRRACDLGNSNGCRLAAELKSEGYQLQK
jgi:TPR repeat protein